MQQLLRQLKRWVVAIPARFRGMGRRLAYGMLAIASLSFCLVAQPGRAIQSPIASPARPGAIAQAPTAQGLVEQGQQLYEAGRLAEAAQVLERAVEAAAQAGSTTEQIRALRNLALVYQSLQRWDAATQAVDTALSLLPGDATDLRASVLDVKGGIHFHQGQQETALRTWEEAAQIYDDLGNTQAAVQNRINQSQALQRLGFYRQAITLLTPLVEQLETQPDSPALAVAWRSLGDALRFVGDLERSQQVLESSVAIAQRLQRADLQDSAQLSLANTLRAQDDTLNALNLYGTLARSTRSAETRVQALSNQASLLLASGETRAAQELWPTLRSQFEQVELNQAMLFARINAAQSYVKADGLTTPSAQELAAFLATATQDAQALGDLRSESYALGTLALLYEESERLEDAQDLNQQALRLAQTVNATDMSYLWQWQLGRIYKAEGDRTGDRQNYEKALNAYSESVSTLQQLRTDLVAVTTQVQVSFQESVEPIHREFVSLLLDEQRTDPSPANIEKAREVIESLQLAELDNFFREACLDTQAVDIDQLDPHAAVIYPILLGDRLETVVSLPNQTLRHYTTAVPRDEIEALIEQLRLQLTIRVGNSFRPGMAKLYDWVMRPMTEDLAASDVETLVFVLDGALRNIPMAALYDGESFLVERYSIALTPGLQLVDPRPLKERDLRVLTGALSESRQGFSALPNVVPEVEQIQSTVPAQVLFNASFTQDAIRTALQSEAESIVHLATHGQFASKTEETFILTWDGQLNINDLSDVLQTSEIAQQEPIELLVLSACQTATGDKYAALGLAGMAVRAGARSTIATLWQVNDEATAMLMEELYAQLIRPDISKAEALRQAQLRVLAQPQFRRHPYFWAPYILVGNWL